MQIVMPPDVLRASIRVLRVGDRLSQEQLLRWVTDHGYEATPIVQEPGQVARRGSILDLFPPGTDFPVRIDFFGDEIDGIRSFDPHSQRSHDRLRMIRLLPSAELPLERLREAADELRGLNLDGLRHEVRTEWARTFEMLASGQTPPSLDLFASYLVDRPTTLTDYLSTDSLVIVDEPSAVELVASQLERQAHELRDAFVANGELPAGLRSPIAPWSRVRQALRARRVLSLGAPLDVDLLPIETVTMVDAPRFAGRLGDVLDDVRQRLTDGWRIAIATDQVDRLTELFEEQDIFPRRDRRRCFCRPLPLAPGTLRFGRRISTAAGPLRNRSSFSWLIWRYSGFASRPGAHIAAAMPNPVRWRRRCRPVTTSCTSTMGLAFSEVSFVSRPEGLNASTFTSITLRATASMYQSIKPTA